MIATDDASGRILLGRNVRTFEDLPFSMFTSISLATEKVPWEVLFSTRRIHGAGRILRGRR